MYRRKPQNSTTGRKGSSARQILTSVVLCGLSFYFGSITTYSATISSRKNSEVKNNSEAEKMEKMASLYKHELNELKLDYERMKKKYQAEVALAKKNTKRDTATGGHHGNGAKEASIFTSTEKNGDGKSSASFFPLGGSFKYMANGMARTDKREFVTQFDSGSPVDQKDGEVIIMYNTESSLPHTKTNEARGLTGDGIVNLSLSESTQNCEYMHVVTIPVKNRNTCTAIVQNFEDWHIRRWIREDKGKKNEKDSSNTSFRAINRGYNDRGGRTFRAPNEGHMKKHWAMLESYFKNFDDVVNELKPIAEKIAVDNTIIVLTCNMGQSELLMNFVCNARAKGLKIDNVLVFPTDEETKELAEGLGLATFHDERNFGKLPKGSARAYGDRSFVAMMFAKVVCVQLINYLGYDLLFQDVDVVWYKNPLEYFHDKENPYRDFDMYFQDDGAHSTRYAPYSANSGFYYVRNNDLTKYFFASLLYHGDIILECTSHQQALIQVMTEHSSLFGLRVKVLDREMDEFPGGWHYHRRNKEFMKNVINEKVNPLIFHMSWTKNKDNKIKFFQQMGEWYTDDKCIQHTRGDILSDKESTEMLFEPCCLAEPNIVCHYRDKPSKFPCKDVDPIDKGRPSFW